MNANDIEVDEIDIEKVLQHLKENLKTIIFITFLITTLTIVYTYFLKPTYSSSVSISFSDQKMSKLSSIIPNELTSLGNKESELETIKLTIETRKFINSVIQDIPLSKRYYIKNKFKKEELYILENLDVTLQVSDILYDEEFIVKPIDDKSYTLIVDILDYEEVHLFGMDISTKEFSLNILKRAPLHFEEYVIQSSNKNLLADNILENLKVGILSDNVLEITYHDSVPKRAKEVVDAIAKKFIAYRLDKKTDEITQTLKFLDTQISDIKITLENEGELLKGYQEKSDAFMPLESSKLLMESISKKEEELKNLLFQYSEVKGFNSALVQNSLNTVSLLNSGINISSIQTLIEFFRKDTLTLSEMELQSKNIEKSITNNLELNSLISELNKKKKLLVDLEFNFTPGHPQVLQAHNNIAELEREIHSYISTHIHKLNTNKTLTKNKISTNIEMTKLSLNKKIKVLRKDIQKQKINLQLLPEKDLTNQELKRKFILSENIYTFLLQKKMEYEITKASTIANTQIIEDAREGLKPIKPNKKLIIAVGFLIALILGVFFSIIRAMLDTKIRNVEIIEKLTDIPLYGMLPKKNNIRFFREALRSIRTNLYFVLPNEKRCVTMLISSTVAGEGKTTVTAGLAEIMSQINKKILVIDLDLRKPRLYQELKKSNKVGVTNYLVEEKSIDELIQSISNNLDFIAAGAVPPNPSELLMSDKFNDLINELMEQYDYILFDTAPIGSVIDASLILKHSDITLLIVKANVAEKRYLESFNKLRIEKNIKSAGIILNQVKLINNKNYGYGYGYGYGDTQNKDT